MNRTQIILIGALLLFAALVAVLALRNRQAPLLPPDADHASFVNAAQCLTCHGPRGGFPKSTNHPLGDDCLRCHGR